MPILHHEFVYACFHPTMDDQGLSEADKIKKFAKLAGLGKKHLTIVTEEGDGNKHDRSSFVQMTDNSMKSRDLSDEENKGNSSNITEMLKQQILKKIKTAENENPLATLQQKLAAKGTRPNPYAKKQSLLALQKQGSQQSRRNSFVSSNSPETPQRSDKDQQKPPIPLGGFKLTKGASHSEKVPLHNSQNNKNHSMKEEDDSSQEFQFVEPIIMKEERLEGTSKRKYGISIWKLNRGQQAYQLNEHPFNMYPCAQKFFISHDSKHIIVFLMNDQEKEDYISIIRILDIETLEVVKEIEEIQSLQIQSSILIDASLIWDSKFLYFQTMDQGYFINIEKQCLDYTMSLYLSQEHNFFQMKHALFKENEPGFLYAIIQHQKIRHDVNEEKYLLYKMNIHKGKNLFNSQNCEATISKSAINYDNVISYNKYMSQIVFPGEQVYHIFSLKKNIFKSYRNVQNCQVQKNGFLSDNIWIVFNDDNYDTFTSSTQSLLTKYMISDLDLDDFRLGDVKQEKTPVDNENCIFVIGKKGENEASSRICINVTKVDETQPFVNFIQETSDYVFLYPYVIYCKGNQELFLQCLHEPEKLVKLDLEDQFICFVDLNYHQKLKPMHLAMGTSDGNYCFRKYESIAYLTQSEDQIFLNVLEYQPYGEEKQYILYKSIQTIQRPKQSYGNIMRALFQRVKHKECKDQDYILILQYRNHIAIRSFFNYFVLNIEKYIYKFPMIYIQQKNGLADMCFFVSKDGYATRVECICFKSKDVKDPLTTVQELKTSNIFIFTYHEEYFYIMDDSLTLKQYQYDQRSSKFKYIKMYEFSMENRDALAQAVDFNDIQVSSKGVYRGLMFYPFYEQSIYNKDTNLIKTDPILTIPDNDLFAGPKKLIHSRYMLYIARGDQRILSNETIHNSDPALNDLDDIQDEEQDTLKESSFDGEVVSENPSQRNIPFDTAPKTILDQNMPIKEDLRDIKEIKSKIFKSKDDFDSLSPGPANHKILRSKTAFQSPKDQKINLNQIQESIDFQSSADEQSSIKISFALKTKNGKIQQSQTVGGQKTIRISSPESKNLLKSKKTMNGVVDPMKSSISSYTQLQELNTQIHNENNHQSNEQVYAWIVPYLDSNVIQLTHNFRENNNPKYQVNFSTFINNSDEVMIEMNKIYYIFTKNGILQYSLDIQKGENKDKKYFQKNNLMLEGISPNMKYFMFYDANQECFEVFELCREKIDEKSLKNVFSKAKISRMKTMKSSSSHHKISNITHTQEKFCYPYIFKYVKTIKEQSKKLIQEDYFNFRQISNNGEIFQMVQAVFINSTNPSKNTEENRRRRQSQVQLNIDENKLIDINELEEFNVDRKSFQFFIDEEEKKELAEKFQLIKEHLASDSPLDQEITHFGFQVINDHLFIKRMNKVEYLKIFEFNQKEQKLLYKVKNQHAKFIRLILDKNAEILRLMSTAQNDLVQMIVVDEKYLYVITWDIVKNMEYQMMQIEKTFNFNAGHIVCKGITERHNYIPLGEAFYDLYYSFPFKFFQSSSSITQQKHQMNINERKLSRFNNLYLDQFENNKIFRSYSYLDLCYMRGLQGISSEQIQQSHIMVQHLSIRIKGMTVFNMFALDFNLLKEIHDEVLKVDEQQNQTNHNEKILTLKSNKLLLLNILYPDYFNQNAFNIAMEKNSPRSIEIMLDSFGLLSQLPLSKYLLPHFGELFQMEIVSFQNYLSTCYFQFPRMREIKQLKWNRKEDYQYIDYHTSYLGNAFYKKIQSNQLDSFLRKRKDDEDDYIILTKMKTSEQSSDEDENDQLDKIENYNFDDSRTLEHSSKPLNTKMKKIVSAANNDIVDQVQYDNIKWKSLDKNQLGEYKRIETFAIEFDWIFRGPNSKSFLQHLATNSNDSIFAVYTVQIIITFLWEKFFYHIRNKIFIPYMVYFVLFFVHVTFIYQGENSLYENLIGTSDKSTYDEETYKNWQLVSTIFIAIIFVFCLYFLLIEIRQMITLGLREYFRGFWNWFDLVSFTLNVAYLINDIQRQAVMGNRILASIAILLMWLKLLYFMRLFAPTAALIRMIVEVFKDIFVFLIIYFIALIGFANALFIISYNLKDASYEALFNGKFPIAILYSYRQGLGDFQTVTYDTSPDHSFWYVLFIAQTVFIQIVLLNLLISIISDTFDKVTDRMEESKMREICQLMYEYEYVINRDKEFKFSKYIIVNKVEKAETNINTDWEGRISMLKSHFQTVASELKRETKQQHESLRDEVIGNSKSMEQKFLDLQSFVFKQSSQMNQMLRKMDKIKDTINIINKNTYKEQEKIQFGDDAIEIEFGEKDMI